MGGEGRVKGGGIEGRWKYVNDERRRKSGMNNASVKLALNYASVFQRNRSLN